jgi:hypothetical protein
VIFPAPPALTGYRSAERRATMKKFLGMTFLIGVIAGAYYSIKMGSPDRAKLR